MNRHQEKQIDPRYTVLLFYKYTHIAQPQAMVEAQRSLGRRLGLTGRIIVAHEGINATLEGKCADVEAYCIDLTSATAGGAAQFGDFSGIHFKKSAGIGTAFPRLSVKARKEIVSSHLDNFSHLDNSTIDRKNTDRQGDERQENPHVDPTRRTGKRLSPEQLRQWFERREDGKESSGESSKASKAGTARHDAGRDFVIIDMRNDFEHAVGHFRDSILPDMHNFRDLPQAVEKIEKSDPSLKEKTVLTVCTGGVRCEKASAYLLERGFKDVYQLDGGIVSYMEKYPARDFDGALYVFDGRVTMHFEKPERTIIGRCALCAAPSEWYADCADDQCHLHFIACRDCADADGRTFCPTCKAAQSTQSAQIKAQIA